MVYTILTTDSLPWSSKTQEWVFFFIVYWFGLLSLKANTISYNEFVTNVTSSKTKKPGFVSRSKSVRVFFCSSIRNKKMYREDPNNKIIKHQNFSHHRQHKF